MPSPGLMMSMCHECVKVLGKEGELAISKIMTPMTKPDYGFFYDLNSSISKLASSQGRVGI